MPDQITKLLDQIDQLDADAEAGPWGLEPVVETQNGWSLGTVRSDTTGESVAADVYDSDGALIALSRTALPTLAQALRAVIESCEETIQSVNKNLLPDERDHANRDHADTILDAITDALGGSDGTR